MGGGHLEVTGVCDISNCSCLDLEVVCLQKETSFKKHETIFLSFFLGTHLWHMEAPRLGVISEL